MAPDRPTLPHLQALLERTVDFVDRNAHEHLRNCVAIDALLGTYIELDAALARYIGDGF